jgi:hypothetical protein
MQALAEDPKWSKILIYMKSKDLAREDRVALTGP